MSSRPTSVVMASESSGTFTSASKRQKRFDHYIVVVLLLSGWSLEWTWGRQEGAVVSLLLYMRLALLAIFFGFYFLNRKQLKSFSTGPASLGTIALLLFFFLGLCLTERVANVAVDTWNVWKDYYYLALLPLWGLIGFDLGGDAKRIYELFSRLAVVGAFLSYISFAAQTVGISGESLIGPMYWPFRFIVIFSFIYFLAVITTGLNRKRSAPFWLAGSALSVFWGLYKFTIVSTLLGLVVWGAILLWKGKSLRKRAFISLCGLTILMLVGLATMNQLTGGTLFSNIDDIYTNSWIHGLDQFESTDSRERFNLVSGGRYRIWEDVLKRIEERPVLGSGPGQRYEGEIVVHNGYLDLVLSFGLLGAAIFLSLLMIWLRRVAHSQPQRDSFLIQLVCIGYIFTILAANLFGSVWIQFTTVSFYLSFFVGISYRQSTEPNSRE